MLHLSANSLPQKKKKIVVNLDGTFFGPQSPNCLEKSFQNEKKAKSHLILADRQQKTPLTQK